MKTLRLTTLLVLAAAALAGGCTVSKTEPPPFQGPSEMSLSLALRAAPDVLSLDGASQSQVEIIARDENGQPKAGVMLRAEILADGVAIDYGSLSARTRVTDSSGRAAFTYTAPTLAGGEIPDLQIGITPTDSGDASAHLQRKVTIRLVAPGFVLPGAPTPSFTFTPTQPTAHTDVLFDASQSSAAVGAIITSYSWNFGDGSSATGQRVTHQFAEGNYTVTLTTTDSNGLSSSLSQLVQVGAGTPPTAVFVFSPSSPSATQPVFFNAGQSAPGPRRTISTYRWSFGDGDTGSGRTVTHRYDEEGTYTVLLTVTDDVGQRSTATALVTVCPVGGCEEEDP